MKIQYDREQCLKIVEDEYLTDRERRIFRMKFMRGLKIEDISLEIDMSRQTVINDLRKIRQKAIEILKEY